MKGSEKSGKYSICNHCFNFGGTDYCRYRLSEQGTYRQYQVATE